MAQLFLNPLIEGMRGRFRGVVLVRCGDDVFLRDYTPPGNPRTDAQQARRGLFADAVRSWQALHNDEKARWNRLARKGRRKTVRGYHLFISSVLYGRTEPVVAGTASFLKKGSSYAPLMKLRCSSVAAPLKLRSASGDALVPLPAALLDPGGR